MTDGGMSPVEPVAVMIVLFVAMYAAYMMAMFSSTGRRGHAALKTGTMLLRNFRWLARLNLPLRKALDVLVDAVSQRQRKHVDRIVEAMDRGELLGDALMASGGSLTPVEAETLRIGERSGQLADALDFCVARRDVDASAKETFLSGLGYPIQAFAILGGLVAYRHKPFKAVFEELGADIPEMTQRVFRGETFLWVAFLAVFGFCLPLVLFSLRWLRPRRRCRGFLRAFVERIVYWIPLIHGAMDRTLLAEFCRDLAMLVRVGTPMHRALTVIAEGTMNPVFADRVRRAAQLVEQGESLGEALGQAGLNTAVSWTALTAQGELSLADALDQLAKDTATTFSRTVTFLAGLFSPLLVLLLGLITAYVVIAMFLPLLNLAKSLMS